MVIGTAALLEYLHTSCTDPPVEWSFCVGADACRDLLAGKWKHSERILELCRLVVLHREGTGSLQDLNLPENSQVLELYHLNDISSSQVRANGNKEELKSMVVPAVLEYMERHQLYAFHDDK